MNATIEMTGKTHQGNAGWAEAVPARGPLEMELDALKGRLIQPLLDRAGNHALSRELLWAANEAAALAWCTICPVLVLPLLLDEKVHAALRRWERQQALLSEAA